jgi:hypothetical protein
VLSNILGEFQRMQKKLSEVNDADFERTGLLFITTNNGKENYRVSSVCAL